MAKSNHYLLILCGGTGPRLWPLSRADYPKQFLTFFKDRSLIQETITRFSKFIPQENIFVISNQKYATTLKKQLAGYLPAKNIILEPEKKNTCMAIIYGSAIIQNLDPQAVITAAPADHFVSRVLSFKKNIKSCVDVASKSNSVVTLGIKPQYPNPAFGYILPGEKKGRHFLVNRFIEKPQPIDAQILIQKKALWNSGIYTFSLKTLAEQLSLFQKKYYQLFCQLNNSLKHPNQIKLIYKLSANLSIDKAISELSPNLTMVKATFHWSDIGEWESIYHQLHSANKNGISTINQKTKYVSYNSKNCLVNSYQNKLVGLVGINNLAIIDTVDALLVCDLKDSFSVRQLVSLIVSKPELKHFFLTSHD